MKVINPHTPMQVVLKKLRKRNVNISSLDALELFGYTGEFHVKDYAHFVKSLEVWEINPDYETSLKTNIPVAKIKITDSLKEIKTTSNKYSLIVVDNNVGRINDSWEHFPLFPYIFRIMDDSAIMILNVVPDIHKEHFIERKKFPGSWGPQDVKEQKEERQKFFGVSAESISIDDMARIYSQKAQKEGFICDWYFAVERSYVYYLVMKLKRAKM